MPLCGVTCKQIKNSKLLCGFPQAMIEARCPTVPRGMAGKPPRAKGATAEAPGQLPLPGSWAAAEYAADCHAKREALSLEQHSVRRQRICFASPYLIAAPWCVLRAMGLFVFVPAPYRRRSTLPSARRQRAGIEKMLLERGNFR